MSRILSGMQPTQSRLHLGNYEGALKNWVKLQEQYDLFCCVVDWHALTTMSENPHEIAHNSREVAKDYIAAGIDPKRSAIFVQSHVKEHAELHLLLSMVTPLGWLERVPTYKEKKQNLMLGNQRAVDLLREAEFLDSLAGEMRGNVSKLRSIRRKPGQVGEDLTQPGASDELTRDQLQQLVQQAVENLRSISVSQKHSINTALMSVLRFLETQRVKDSSTVHRFQHAWDAVKSMLNRAERTSLSNPDYIKNVVNAWTSSTSTKFTPVQSLINEFRHRADAYNYVATFVRECAESVDSNYGLLGYPVLQAADILLYKPYGVPVGKDQAPHLEISREIARRFNHLYKKEVFPEFKNLIGDVPVLMGTDGRKMSKSYDNSIYLNETEDETAKKIMGSFTTPTKERKTDPGVPENCAVCNLLKIYSGDWQTQWEEDRQGIRGCMQNKKECVEAVNEALRPMRERRKQLDDSTIEHILEDGASRAREVAAATMSEVREAMGLR